MACREDTGRDVRVFPTEVRPEQDPRKTVRPENATAKSHMKSVGSVQVGSGAGMLSLS